MPYAMMGSVDDVVCCGFHSVNGMQPGWGCSAELVKEISDELQARKVGRGNIAQLRNQENTMYQALELDVRSDIVLKHFEIQYPPQQFTMTAIYGPNPPTLPSDEGERGSGIHLESSAQFETRSWTITNHCCETVCCCCQTSALQLNDEEAVVSRSGPCSRSTVREPYAQLGSVEKSEVCCGVCSSVETDSALISPGWGCSRAVVEDIAAELQRRKVKRGNIAQIKMQENLMIEIIKMGVKLDLIALKKGIQYPPSQATMDRVFGAHAQIPTSEYVIAARRSLLNTSARPSTLMDVVIPQQLTGGDTFTVKGPRRSFEVTVPAGHIGGQRMIVQVPGPHSQAETELTALNG